MAPLQVEVFALWLTYAASTGLALWLARRFVGCFGWRVGVLLACAPLLFTGKALLLGQLYGPADLYYAHEPWTGLAAERGVARIQNPILSDLAFASIPWRAAVREAVVNGRFPFWNRFVLGGTPLLAASSAAIFHPSTWLGIFLPLPLSWTFSCAFALFLAVLSGFLYFREIGLSPISALTGAVGWGFSTYVLFWDGWSVGTSTAAFPLLLLGLRRVAREERRGIGLTVAGLLLAVFGGHPESLLHACAAGAVAFLWELAPRGAAAIRPWRNAVAAAGLALLLSGPQLLPLLEALPHSCEYRTRKAALAVGPPVQSVSAGEAARRLLPAILPFSHGIYGQSPVQPEREDGSGMPLAYAGSILFPLAFFSIGRRPGVPRGRLFFCGVLVAGLLAGASAPGLLDLLVRLPGFSLALNYRLVFLAGFGLAGLGAFGVERLLRGEFRRVAGPALAAALLLGIAGFAFRGVFQERGLPAAFVGLSLSIEVAPLLLLAVFVLLPRVTGRRAALAALLLLTAERAAERHGIYPTLPAATLAPPLPELARAIRDAPGRLVATGLDFRPNAAALYGFEDIRGYESIVLDRLADTFPLWSQPQTASFNRVDAPLPPFLSFLNVGSAIARPGSAIPAGWSVVHRDAHVEVWKNSGVLPRVFVPRTLRYETDARRTLEEMGRASEFAGTVWIESPRRSSSSENGRASLQVRATGPDFVVASQASGRTLVATSIPAWPGWRAQSGGRQLPTAVIDHAFVGFFVPAGSTLTRLTYRPPSWTAGLWSALAGALLCAMAAARRRLVNRK